MAKQHFPIVAALGASVFFGFSFVFSRSALQFVTPIHLLAIRFLLAALVMNFLRYFGVIKVRLSKKQILQLLPLGLIQPIAYFLFETIGISLTSASEGGMVVALIPVFTLLLAVVFLKERPSLIQLAMVCLSVAGVFLIGAMQATDQVGQNIAGLLILLGAPISGAAFSVLSRYLSKNFKPVEMTYVMMNVGAVFFLSIGLGQHLIAGNFLGFWQPVTNLVVLSAVVYLAIFSSIGAFFLLNFALSQLTSSQVSAFPSTTTLIAVIAAIVFLGESLYWFHYLGGALIIIGVWGTNYFANRPAKRFVSKTVASLICLVVGTSAFGVSEANTVGKLDVLSLAPILDEFFATNMTKYNVPGAAFAIVKDGEIVLSKGYGFANLEKQIRVSPDQTVFRIASVTKLPTFLALLQLVDQGLISLEESVASYVAEDFPNADLSQVMVKHLLTHTEGFYSIETPAFALEIDEMMTLKENLRKKLHTPVQEPGTMISYNSLGAVLAGYIIEKVTNMPYARYLEEHVFNPLGMTMTTAEQLLPHHLQEYQSQTYLVDDGKAEVSPYLYSHQSPSGGVSSTVNDLARLTIAILEGNEALGGQVSKVLSRQFSAHQDLPGATFGFLEHYQNGVQALVRDGSGLGVRVQIMVVPNERLGIVYAQNTRGDELITPFTDIVLSTLFPNNKKAADIRDRGEGVGIDPAPYLGVYRGVHFSRSFEKGGAYLYGLYLEIKEGDNGALTLTPLGPGDVAGYGGFDQGVTLSFKTPTFLESQERELYVAFRTNEKGEVTHLFSGSGYHSSYEKVAWYEYPSLHGLIGAVFLLGFFLMALCFAYQVFVKKEGKGVLGLSLSLLSLFYPFVFFAAAFFTQIAGFPILAFEEPLLFKMAMAIPFVTTLLTVGAILLSLRLRHRLLALVSLWSLLYIPYLIYWHLFPGFFR